MCSVLKQHKHEEDTGQFLISGFYNQMKKILDATGQPVLIYLDDNNKVCNQLFADFLGYQSPQEFSNTLGFLEVFIDDEASRNAFMTAYWSTINGMNASTIQLVWKRKNGSRVQSTTIMVPMAYGDRILLVQFIIIARAVAE